MSKVQFPVTPAIRVLRDAGIAFSQHVYNYEEKGGTRHAAEELGVEEHTVIKTLVMQDENRKPLIILMHGDREVGVGMLAKAIGAKSVQPCDPAVAQKHTGYLVGGTSPLGTRAVVSVYVEESIFNLERIYVNGGKRGFLFAFAPECLRDLLPIKTVNVAVLPK
jgi:Cys-tRNA(Pro) deacylase